MSNAGAEPGGARQAAEGAFLCDGTTSLVTDLGCAATRAAAERLAAALARVTGVPAPITAAIDRRAAHGAIRLTLDPAVAAGGYRLEVRPNAVRLAAADADGLARGVARLAARIEAAAASGAPGVPPGACDVQAGVEDGSDRADLLRRSACT